MAADSPTPDVRLQHYLWGVRNLSKGQYTVSGRNEGFLVLPDMSMDDLLASIAKYPFGEARLRRWGPRKARRLLSQYISPLIDIYREVEIKTPFLVLPGDNMTIPFVPVFSRLRPWPQSGACVPARISINRHWDSLAELPAADRPFYEKEKRLVWRGSTTGRFAAKRTGEPYGQRFHVMRAMDRIEDARIDLGYSKVVQVAPGSTDRPIPELNTYLRPPLSLAEQLQARYLLSLEGNDGAPELKWMLLSNSVVIMPALRLESWACEGLLKPFQHFVPVLPDLSNLEEVFAWCLENDDECRAIAERGQAFMSAFLDPNAEHQLFCRLVEEYARRVVLKPSPGSRLSEALSPAAGD